MPSATSAGIAPIGAKGFVADNVLGFGVAVVKIDFGCIYARVHDKPVMADYLQAMKMIKGEQTAITEPNPIPETVFTLLDKLQQESMSDVQQQILDELRCCLLSQ
ncbi:MAG: hypothetical protein WAM60_19520 [Candidatus Promineifilaceae bacterium]